MTISVSPALYPDELMYSYFARYKALLEYRTDQDALKDFYGQKPPRVQLIGFTPFTQNNDLARNGWLPDDRTIIAKHTLMLLYGAFLLNQLTKNKPLTENLPALLKSSRLRSINAELRTMGLAYCPACTRGDYERHGEAFWRRLQNIYGVFVCPRHMAYLERVPLPEANLGCQLILPPARAEIPSIRPINLRDQNERFLITLAEDLQWLSIDPDPLTFRQRVADLVVQGVQQLKLDYRGRPSISKSTAHLLSRFGPRMLKFAHLRAKSTLGMSWCQRLTGFGVHLEPITVAIALHALNLSLRSVKNANGGVNPIAIHSGNSKQIDGEEGALHICAHARLPATTSPIELPATLQGLLGGETLNIRTRCGVGRNNSQRIVANKPEICMMAREAITRLRSRPKKLSRDRIAEQLGVSKGTLYRWMTHNANLKKLVDEAFQCVDDHGDADTIVID